MRKIIRRLFLLAVFIFVFIEVFQPQTWFQEETSKKYIRLAKGAKNKTTYLMSQEEWILFSIPSFATQLKFLSTANINPNLTILEDMSPISYSLVYEFLDKNNHVLSSQTYHFRTSFVRFQNTEGRFVEKNFYLDTPLRPNSSQSLFLTLKNHKNASKIRLKIQSKDISVVDVGIRSYYLEATPPSRRHTTWQRMSKEHKSHLSRGNIYEVDHLTQEEKYYLVSSLWKPNGPIGIEGKAYRIRRLFIHPDADSIYPYMPFIPTIYSDENLSATRKLPEGNYSLRLSTLVERENHIFVSIHEGKETLHSHSYHVKKHEKEKTLEIHIPKEGLLEINSSQPLSILIKEQHSQEILDLPPMIASEYYRLEQNQSIAYDFYHAHPRFLRIECRSHEHNFSTLSLEMTDREGNVTNQAYSLSFLPYRYDYIKPFLAQSKPFYLYIALPEEIKTLRFSASDTLILRLSTRSQTMVYPIYSFAKETQPLFQRLMPWFTLRPKDFNTPSLSENKITLYKQPPPPKVNPFIALGQFAYEQLLPNERWYGHNLLLKRSLGENYIRPQSWSNIYSKLKHKQSHQIQFKDDIGRREVSPHLLYLNKSFLDAPLSIYLNNELLLRHILHGASATIPLPTLALASTHTLRFSQHRDRDLFINHYAQEKEVFLKRKFIAFRKKLHFTFHKTHANESLGFQIATDKKEDDNESLSLFSFHVQLSHTPQSSTSAYLSYTFKNYLLHADISQEKALHITHLNKTLSVSSPLYLNIGENLPRGEYTITVCPPQIPSKAYLFINHIILDEKAKTRISKEIL